MPIEATDFEQGSFDTVIMMGNNFGLFGSFEKTRRLLKKFSRITSEDALIIASSRDPYQTGNPNAPTLSQTEQEERQNEWTSENPNKI